ncbi:hypothetical protein MKW98_000011 [Papaver atlanticum]|uniref:BAH domain-containing protein n=1 Tax=Papaver atlanticum TaxID=357466 RepID=A0AAD4S5X3_9MAGN|nr:hypothetical protein MKW98_000011 [Papaver atlanticum]
MCQYLYQHEDVADRYGRMWERYDDRELFYSLHQEEIPSVCLLHACIVEEGEIVEEEKAENSLEEGEIVDEEVEDNQSHLPVDDTFDIDAILAKALNGDDEELHNRLDHGFSVRLWSFVRPEKVATSVVDSIVATGLDPFSAFDRARSAEERVEISQYGDRFSRKRHFMMGAFDYENLRKLKQINEAMPKTSAGLFSYDKDL